jgi:hypothetical protein
MKVACVCSVPDGSCESNLRLNDTHDMHFRLARPIRGNVIGYSQRISSPLGISLFKNTGATKTFRFQVVHSCQCNVRRDLVEVGNTR